MEGWVDLYMQFIFISLGRDNAVLRFFTILALIVCAVTRGFSIYV